MTVIHLGCRMYYLDKDRVKTDFKVDEKNRVVVCIITASFDVESRLMKYGFIDEDVEWKYFNGNTKPCRYVGIARCAEGDEWNPAFGKKLAEYRASEKRMRDVNRRLDAYVSEINKKIADLTNYGYMKASKMPEESNNGIN